MNHENYDFSFPDQPVVDLYLPIWAKLPAFRHKPAFIWKEDGPNQTSLASALTYDQLNTSAHFISSQLLHSLQKGDTVVMLCAPGLEFVEVIFGCQRAGIVAVPLTPPHPSFAKGNHHHLVRVMSQTKPKAALASRSYINRVKEYLSSCSLDNNRLSELLKSLTWIASDELKRCNAEHWEKNLSPYIGCRADEAYLIQYSSGATGIPKPVIVTAGAAAHNVRVGRKAYDLNPNSVIVSWLPQYHDCGLMFLLITIVSGATCVLTSPNAFITRPRIWLELISEYKGTCTPVPLFTLPLVVRRGGVGKGITPINLGSMKNLIIINEPLYQASIEEFVRVFTPFGLSRASISPSYGLAEVCTFVSTAWRSENEGKYPTYKNLLPSAKLPSSREEILEEDIRILIVNEETCEPVKDGTEGEIWISSPSNASGYLHHPSLTREVFNGRLKNKVAECYVRTGDRGIVKGHDRYLFVTGRCPDVIKLPNGMEIHPHFMETVAYNSCPGQLRGGCLTAFEVSGRVVIVGELQRSNEEVYNLRNVCLGIRDGILKKEGVEVGMVVLVKSGNVPKTTSGKVQRWAAKLKFQSGEMNIVMKMEFGESVCKSVNYGIVEQEMKGKDSEEKVEVDKNREEMFFASKSTRSHLTLQSSL